MVARRADAIQGQLNVYDPREARGGKVTPELLDTVSPDTTGNVRFYVAAYPAAREDAPVAMKIEIWRDGQIIMQAPQSQVLPDSSGCRVGFGHTPGEEASARSLRSQSFLRLQGHNADHEAGLYVEGTTLENPLAVPNRTAFFSNGALGNDVDRYSTSLEAMSSRSKCTMISIDSPPIHLVHESERLPAAQQCIKKGGDGTSLQPRSCTTAQL